MINNGFDQLINALKGYQEGAISLGELVSRVELSRGQSSDQMLTDYVFDALVALEEIYARTQIGDFDFEKHGRNVVDRTVCELLTKIEGSS